jgi:hypothetical protein
MLAPPFAFVPEKQRPGASITLTPGLLLLTTPCFGERAVSLPPLTQPGQPHQLLAERPHLPPDLPPATA